MRNRVLATWVDIKVFDNLHVQTSRPSLPAPRFSELSVSTAIEITIEVWKWKWRASSHCDSRAGVDAGVVVLPANGPIKRRRWGVPKIELLFVPSTPFYALRRMVLQEGSLDTSMVHIV